jgi:hypothetical protein
MVQLKHQAPPLMAHTTTQYERLDSLVNLPGRPSDRKHSLRVFMKQHRKNADGASSGEDQTHSPLEDDTPQP